MVFHEPDSLTPSSLPSGDVGSAVELLEEVYTRPGSTSPSMSFVFRKVLEEGKEEAVDKCKTHTHTQLSLRGLYVHSLLFLVQMVE